METTTHFLAWIACATILLIAMFLCLFFYLYTVKMAKAKGQKPGVSTDTLLGFTIVLAVTGVLAVAIAFVVRKRGTPAYRRRQRMKREDRIYELRMRARERARSRIQMSVWKIERALEVIAEEEEEHIE